MLRGEAMTSDGLTPVLTPRAERMAALPGRVLADPIARRWAALYDAAGPGYRWDQVAVEGRLGEAMALLKRVGGAYGPKEFGSAWPIIAATIQATDGGELPPRVTAADVSQMEAAIRWPMVYVDGLGIRKRYSSQLAVLHLWLRCKATGEAFEKAARRRGIADSTSRHHRWQAMLLIAIGLMEDGAAAPDEAEPTPGPAPQAPEPAPVPDAAGGAFAPPELWAAIRAALSRRRPYDSPRQLINAVLIEQVKREFAGQELSKRLLRDMETRRRQLRVLARREGLLDDGGPR
jgi:hypothetical protein